MNRSKLLGALTLAVTLVVLLVLPALTDDFWLRVGTGALMWSGLACSWNIVGGYAGYMNFGQSAFFGIGAYTTGIFMQPAYGLPFFATIPVAVLIAALIAVAVGLPTLKLRGPYFAIATWALAEALLQLARILDITGGAGGMTLPVRLDNLFFYYVMLAAAVIVFGLTYLLCEKSRFGYAIKAVRDHESAAEMLAINTALVKNQAFVLSAAMASVFGSIFAYWITFINPDSVLGSELTNQMIVMVLLGGLGNVWGPALGGVTLYVLNRLIWSIWGSTAAYIVILGVVILGVILFLPNGLISLFGRRRSGQVLLHTLLRRLTAFRQGGS